MAAQDPESDRVTELFDELATIGATRPDELLTVVSKSINLLTKNTGISVNTTNTGRQLEFVLLPITDQTYVSVGVDRRDDQLTSQNIYRVHSFCLSALTEEVWPLGELPDYWDKPHCLVGLGLEASLTLPTDHARRVSKARRPTQDGQFEDGRATRQNRSVVGNRLDWC
jgi:hypothetical protein